MNLNFKVGDICKMKADNRIASYVAKGFAKDCRVVVTELCLNGHNGAHYKVALERGGAINYLYECELELVDKYVFTPKDLKTGMKVVLRNGSTWLVMRDVVLGDDNGVDILSKVGDAGWLRIGNYSDSMNANGANEDLDIVAVYAPASLFAMSKPFSKDWTKVFDRNSSEIEKLEAEIAERQAMIEKLKASTQGV